MVAGYGQTDNEDDSQPDAQLELYALDLLDPDEAAAVERRLRVDPAARERVRELRGVASLLALDLDPIEPPPSLRGRILDAARAESAQAAPTTAAPMPTSISLEQRRRERWSSAWLPWAVAAVLAIALIGSMGWNLRLRDELDERTQAVTLPINSEIGTVTGRVVVINDDGTVLLSLAGLPEPPPGMVYQVWLIADGPPQPNVTFAPNRQGYASVAVPGDIDQYQLLAVTTEPDGGSEAPTTDPFLSSELTVGET